MNYKMTNKKEVTEIKQGYAIVSLLAGISGVIFVIIPYIGIIMSIMAIVFYAMQQRNGRNGMATAGLILGIISMFMNFFALVLVVMLASAF